MGALSVVLFFLYTWGFGFSLAKFVKETESFFERNVIRIGLGLAAVPLVGVMLSLFKIPVDWRIFLGLSLLHPLFYILKNYKNFKPNLNLKFRKSDLNFLLVILIFSLALHMYLKGAFAYPYLEDDDSWSHALGVKYVSVQKTFFNQFGGIHYLDPYPPVYDGILGLMHQTSPSLMWTLKFFNALIISLSILFFYLLVKELTNNSAVALFSTIALSMIPAYLSHFIWAHSFVPAFIFLSFLFLERTKHDKKWMYLASVAIAALILTTVTQSLKFMFLFLIYLAVKCAIEKRFVFEIFFAGALGFILSLIWWIPLAYRYGSVLDLLKKLGLASDVFALPLSYLNSPYLYLGLAVLSIGAFAIYYFMKNKLAANQKSILGVAFSLLILVSYSVSYSFVNGVGTADRIYDFNDFFIAHKQNLINNPLGLGIAVSALFFITLIFVISRQFSVIKAKKESMPKTQFHILLYINAINSILLAVSLLSFFSFRFKPGTLIKQWMLREPSNYSYIYSFSFKVWGIYLLITTLIIVASVYIFLICKGCIEKQKFWIPLSLLWFVYSFAGLYDIPTQMFTFRIWAMLAFILSIFVGYGFISTLKLAQRLGAPQIIVWTIFIALIFYTSGIQKYAINTSIWPPGGFWTSNDEIKGYIWLKDNLPSEAKIFTFSNNGVIIGFDKYICHWCQDVREFQSRGFNSTAQELHKWLKSRNYQYFVLDGQTARKYGINETNQKLQSTLSSGLFKPVYQTNGFILLNAA